MSPVSYSRFPELFLIFLRLGLTSFGGPIAHLGYFRQEFVERRGWLTEQSFADLVALCQFLPGPTSSQVCYSIGMIRAGLFGAIASWLGFTLPSGLLMILAAYGIHWAGNPQAAPWIHGLKIVAVAVVAQAVWSMATKLCIEIAVRNVLGASLSSSKKFTIAARSRSLATSLQLSGKPIEFER
jgi:chromate transporter